MTTGVAVLLKPTADRQGDDGCYASAMKFLRSAILFMGVVLIPGCHSIDDSEGEKESVDFFRQDFPNEHLSNLGSIKARHVLVRDAVAAFLVFSVEPKEAEAILGKGFQGCSREEFEKISGGANRPEWWVGAGTEIECYKREPWRENMSYSVAVIGFDRTRNQMFFCHSAFD